VTAPIDRVAGTAILQTVAAGRISSEAAIFASPAAAHVTTYVDTRGFTESALAIANPTGSAIAATLHLRSPSGLVLSSRTVTLPAFGQSAPLLTQLFPAHTEFEGTVEVVTDGASVSAIGLRYDNPGGTVFTTIPVTVIHTPFVAAADTDGDGLPDSWESQFRLNAAGTGGDDGAAGDPDGDGVTNLVEYQSGTDPLLPNVWMLAEGATGFFTERIAVANPGVDAAAFTVTFLIEGGGTVTQNYTLAAQRRLTIAVNEIPGLSSAAVSAVLTTTAGGVVVERTMMWDGRDGSHYGGHTGKAVQRARTTWYLAEGEASFFDTYILLANATGTAATVTLTFQLESGSPIVHTRTVPANARVTVYANDVPGLRGKAFSTTIGSDVPISVERAMYFGNAVRLFNGGHEAAAVESPATSWFVAEGRTGPFFDMYLLLANPGATSANVTVRFLKPGGSVVTEVRSLGPMSRATIHVDSVAGLADSDVSASITSDQPIIVERAMYWPDPFTNWYEAHNSSGVTATGTTWALAEGEVGGTLGFETYIALANAGDANATVTLTFLRTSGSPVALTRAVGANSRVTVSAGEAGLTAGERFGVRIDSTQPVAVERAMYWNGGGQFWGGGSNETAIRIGR